MRSTPLGTTAVSPASIKHNSYGYGRFVSSSGVSNFSIHRRRRHSSFSISQAPSQINSGLMMSYDLDRVPILKPSPDEFS